MQSVWGLAAIAALGGCAFDDGTGDVVARKTLKVCKQRNPKANEKNCITTTTVGATGGIVEHPNGVTLTVPAGALDHDVAISVLDEGAPGPDGTQMYSPVFTFEPDGTLFARPVQVAFQVPAAVTAATVYWSRSTPGGVAWDRIPATVSDGVATSQITHFSGGGAGVPSDAFDLHIIQRRTWDRLDRQAIEHTDFSTGAATAYAPGGPIASEAWIDGAGQQVLGEGMIRNIPAGEMWVQLGNLWVYTSLAATPVIDLGNERFGTLGRALPDPNLPHPVTIHVQGAEPTTLDDAVELLVPDANAFYFGFPEEAGVPIVPAGVTSFDLDWDLSTPFFTVNGLITTEDKAFVAQMVPRTTPAPASLPYRQMTKIGIAAPADVPQSGGVLNVTLGDLPANAAHSYTVFGGEYQSMFATNDPDPIALNTPADGRSFGWPTDVRVLNTGGLDVSSAAFDLQGVAGGRNVGRIGATADFAFMTLPSSVMTGTFDTGTLSYGVPGDTAWDTFAGLGGTAIFVVQLRCPVNATPCSTPGGWARQLVSNAVSVGYTDARLVGATELAPVIGPISNFQINSADAKQFQAGVGLQPTISWTTTNTVPIAPFRALAAPELYRITIYHWTLDSSTGQWRTRRNVVANLSTTHTSLTLPATLLQSGEVYSMVVTGTKRDATVGISPIQEPRRFRYPEADWSVGSAPFTP